ncbi:MAG: hypothetical protein PHX83_06885 [Acidobacteriia bacterium]|nr:hypothetical protein [Terriglobia bacterium]
MNPQTFPFKVTLDNGDVVLSVTMRRPTIDDQLTFRAAMVNGFGKAITGILTTCTVSVEDPGVWLAKADAEGKEPPCSIDWERVTSGLRMWAMLTLKIKGKEDGHLIPVDLVCPMCKRGENEFSDKVDARPIEDGGELLWFEPDDGSAVIDSIISGTPMSAEIGGIPIKLKPQSGTIELKLQAASEALHKSRRNGVEVNEASIQNDVALRGRALQLATVDGIHVNDIGRWVKSLPEDLYDELEAAIEASDWGVELSFVKKCPRGHAVAGEVPFEYLFGRPNAAMKSLRDRQRERAKAKMIRPASPA